MILDAHHHLWRIGDNGHEWPTPDLGAIYRDFDAAELNAVLTGAGVDATVLIQSQPADADTEWMLAVAAEIPQIRGVVGWTDLAAPDAPERIAELARRPKLKGLRPMLQGLPRDDWIIQPDVQPALKAMIDHGLTFDALVFTRHLPFVTEIARAYPDLAIVIDHCAKPPVGRRDGIKVWREKISQAAKRPNIYCKISGLPTELPSGAPMNDLSQIVRHVLQIFGPDRLMWGSDWPVVNLQSDYGSWLSWASQELGDLASYDRRKIFYETASRFYKAAPV